MFKNIGEKIGLGLLGIVLILIVVSALILIIEATKVVAFVLAGVVIAYAIGSLMYRKGFRLNTKD